MAPRQREAAPSAGLLASAFSFVTREIESFVTAATGGEVQPKRQQEEQPEASSSRVTLDGKRRDRDDARGSRDGERERERRAKRVRKRSEVESERARARRRVRREQGEDGSDDERDRALKAMKKRMMPPPLPPAPAPRSRSSEREAADDEDDEPLVRPPPAKPAKKKRDVVDEDPEPLPAQDVAKDDALPPPSKKSMKGKNRSADPSELMPPPPPPIPSPPALTARLGTPAPTMPGSLFPRSASLMPETPIVQRAVPRPRTPTPPPEPIAEEAEEDEVVEEQPRESPSRGRSQDRYSAKFRDKRPETSEPSSVRERSRQSESSERAASSSRRSLDEPEHAEPVARLRSSKGKERACDTSGEIRVRGKERELREAKENHARYAHERDDGERERDKQRIRMLEEEVARLRAELALKTNGAMMPPPPPPPPPPPLFRPVAPTASSGNTDNFLASARASLKPTAPPVEAPINTAYSGARAKKAGIPTVNVPSDKMAAFLREMKNVRLRRVGGLTGNASMGPPMSTAGDVAADTGVSDRSMDAGRMSRARMAATLGERSFDLGVAARLEIGQKRKRDAVEESSAGPSKRRETTFLRQEDTGASRSSQSSASSSQSSASSSAPSSSSRTSSFDMPPPRSQPSRPRLNAPLRIWPTRTSTADTDLTTPSLCSDNENDHEHDDKLPDTPSDSGRGRSGAKAAAVVRQPPPRSQPEREVIDVDALETPPKRLPSPKSPVGEKKGLFARRPPVSPLPASAMSPNKPKPPGRTAKSKIPLALPRRVPRVEQEPAPQEEIDDASESDDDQGPPATTLSMTQTTRGLSESVRDEASRPGPSRMRRGSSASSSIRGGSQSREARPESRMSNHARRRLTLDEELRRAGDSLWQPSDEEEQDAPGEEAADEPEVDSGELVALGTRSSKRGFLAGGGGAGPPVFMGEGYVQGVVAEERSRTRSRSGTSEGSRSRAYAGEGSRRRR